MTSEHAIGALSRTANVKVPTIRYYESIGLLPRPARTSSNRRVYDEDAVRRLKFIRHARELGFELPAVRRLLEFAEQPQRSCTEVDRIAREHLREIDSRIDRLTALRTEVHRMLEQCSHGRVGECRIIEVLGHHELCGQPEH